MGESEVGSLSPRTLKRPKAGTGNSLRKGRPGAVRFAAGVVGLGTPGQAGLTQSCVGQVFEKAPVLSDPRVQHLRLGHPSNSCSCGLVKFLKKYLLRLCSWCKGGRGWGRKWRGRSSSLKKTSWEERDADAEVERRPKAVHGFLDSWECGGVSFLRRVGSCKTSATLRPEKCDAPFLRRRFFSRLP